MVGSPQGGALVKLFTPLYERVLDWSRHRHAERYLAALSFAESSFFPIPVDVMLAPMCLADRNKAFRYALVAMVFSVLGGAAGYAIGYLAFEAIEPWLKESHYWGAYQTSRSWFDSYGFWAVFIAGFSPIPYKVFTIAAGVAALGFPGSQLAQARRTDHPVVMLGDTLAAEAAVTQGAVRHGSGSWNGSGTGTSTSWSITRRISDSRHAPDVAGASRAAWGASICGAF